MILILNHHFFLKIKIEHFSNNLSNVCPNSLVNFLPVLALAPWTLWQYI